MKHLFLLTLVCGATNLFGQHIASSSLSVMRNARALSTLSSLQSPMAFDAQLVQKQRMFKPCTSSSIASQECKRFPLVFSSSCKALVPAVGSMVPLVVIGICLQSDSIDPAVFLFQGPLAVWALSALCIYKSDKFTLENHTALVKAHNDLAHQGTQVLQKSFKHPFINEVLPFRGCPDLKQSFGKHVERSKISSEDAYKELEDIHQQLTKVITDNRYIAGEDSQRDVFDKVKAMRNDLALVLANVAPDNTLNNARKIKYAYMHTPEHITNRVQSSD